MEKEMFATSVDNLFTGRRRKGREVVEEKEQVQGENGNGICFLLEILKTK